MASKLRLEIANGTDPNVEKTKRKLADAEKLTVSSAFETYKSLHVIRLREKTRNEYIRAWEKHILPKIGQSPLEELRKATIIELVDKVAIKTPTQANRLLTYIRSFSRWCVGRGYLEHDPTLAVPKPLKEQERARVLNMKEVQKIMEAAQVELETPHLQAFQLLILSGLRRSEVCGLRHDEISSDRIRISATRSKNHKAFDTPLIEPLRKILEGVEKNDGEYVFSSTNGERPIDLHSKMVARVKDASGIKDWRLHDFRRACSTYLEDHGTPRFITDRVLNHADHSSTAVYAKSTYFNAKQQALSYWAASVLGTHNGDNIVQFRFGEVM